jgi:hypothetical protein
LTQASCGLLTVSVQIDLAALTGSFVLAFAIVGVTLETHGPFESELAPHAFLFFIYAAFQAILGCIVAMQLAQAKNL